MLEGFLRPIWCGSAQRFPLKSSEVPWSGRADLRAAFALPAAASHLDPHKRHGVKERKKKKEEEEGKKKRMNGHLRASSAAAHKVVQTTGTVE